MGGINPSFCFFGGTLTFLSFICVFGIGWISHTIFIYIFSQLELQKRIDEKEINIFKRKIVRTIKSNFPHAFSHLVDFDSWDSLVKNIEKQIKKGG